MGDNDLSIDMRDEYEFSPEQLRKGIRGKYAAGQQVEATLRAETAGGEQPADEDDALAVLEKLIGTVEGPSDLAAEHDYYLYDTPKQADQDP
jgi:hypothetical protein